MHLHAEGKPPGWLALCNLILLLPLLQEISLVPSPAAGPRLALPSSQAGGRAPLVIKPLLFSLPMGKPFTTLLCLTPQTEAILGVDGPSQLGPEEGLVGQLASEEEA